MKVNFTETVLRDANQSLIATRMPYEDFEAILPELDKAGYYSLECWGGATFDSCLRYLNEDPWERLRKIRKACPNTKLQMLLRGQNLLGYKHYPDDVVRLFVRKSVENGIDIIRIFDALNDLRNIETAVDETIKCGAHASGTICYTTSPIHNIESYIKLAKDLESMGVQSVCIKDMAGIMDPQTAYDLVKGIKENISLPVIVHTHSTTGLGPVTLQKAVEAGADVIDTAISCFSNGTSQPPTETMAYILQKEVNQIMEAYVGIVRSNTRLIRAWNRLDILYEETERLFKRYKASRELCELRNMINIGYLITRQAMERKESRGLHYTIDYPHAAAEKK